MTTKTRPRLSYCGKCQENSVTIKVYTRKKDDVRTRVQFCLNKGCGFRLQIPFLSIFISLIISSNVFAYTIPAQDHKGVTNILYAESANDKEGWTAKLNTYYKGRYQGESLLDAMKRVCSSYHTKSDQYQRAELQLLNPYELRVYVDMLQVVKDFDSDNSWEYVHHENIGAFYSSKEHAIKHLKKAWGGGVDFINTKKIGLETYFKRKIQ